MVSALMLIAEIELCELVIPMLLESENFNYYCWHDTEMHIDNAYLVDSKSYMYITHIMYQNSNTHTLQKWMCGCV